jgi:hypothetical protein
MEIEDKIEQLYIRIKDQEKIYALALKMRKDVNSLRNLKTDISNLKEELQQLLYWYKGGNVS